MDELEEEGYERFVAGAAESCRSCVECSDVPCAGCLAGGLCDLMCSCDRYGGDEVLELGGEGGCA